MIEEPRYVYVREATHSAAFLNNLNHCAYAREYQRETGEGPTDQHHKETGGGPTDQAMDFRRLSHRKCKDAFTIFYGASEMNLYQASKCGCITKSVDGCSKVFPWWTAV